MLAVLARSYAMTHSPGCPLCGSRNSLQVSDRDRDGRPLRNVLCQDCGLVHVDPPPSRTDLDAWYEHAYRIDYKGVVEPRPHHVLRAGRVALDRLSRIGHLLAGRPRTLDVGSGGGEMLYMLIHAAGARAEGLEPNQGYAGHARERLGLPVRQGFVERGNGIEGGFELITIYHVLEHLAEPTAVARTLHDWLAPGGHLVVEVPNVEATCQAPAHTFHKAHLSTWGLPTLSRLGLQAGLTPVSTWTSSDGGNIQVIFRRDDAAAASTHGAGSAEVTATAGQPVDPAAGTQGYAERVLRILRGHTTLSHYLSGQPFARLAARLRSRAGERRAVREHTDPTAILDGLIREAGLMRQPGGSSRAQ
jgi:SAM-dependent methyltransferase